MNPRKVTVCPESVVAPSVNRLPKLCGADMELGNFIVGDSGSESTGYRAARGLLAEIDGIAGDASATSSRSTLVQRDSPGYWKQSFWETKKTPSDYDSQDWGRKFLRNGGCCYIDLNHLEICLPEVISAYDHLAACHAMYRLARNAAAAFNERLPEGQKAYVLANNSDGLGHSYGSHLNFLITRTAWENIFHRRIQYQMFLAAYQASSIIFTGLGKVGAENGTPDVDFQIAQRADFCEVLVGPQTTHRRPILNSRDEALCGTWRHAPPADSAPAQMARLHVIFYDHNLCHVAGFLKVGVMQIILAMIEAEEVDFNLVLDDPVEAVVRWSHDPTLQVRARLLSGREVTAVGLQWRVFEKAQAFVASGGCEGVVPCAGEILALWGDTLAKLQAGNYQALAPRLDWVLKRTVLELALRDRPRLGWTSPEIRHLDRLYSNLDPAAGLYWAYENSGLVQRLVTEAHIARFMDEPPADTRAWGRAALLQMADPSEVDAVDWDYIRFCFRSGTPWAEPRYHTVSLANPLAHTRNDLRRVLPESGHLQDAALALGARVTSGEHRAFGSTSSSSLQPVTSRPVDETEVGNPLPETLDVTPPQPP